jgi:hypothetical protein
MSGYFRRVAERATRHPAKAVDPVAISDPFLNPVYDPPVLPVRVETSGNAVIEPAVTVAEAPADSPPAPVMAPPAKSIRYPMAAREENPETEIRIPHLEPSSAPLLIAPTPAREQMPEPSPQLTARTETPVTARIISREVVPTEIAPAFRDPGVAAPPLERLSDVGTLTPSVIIQQQFPQPEATELHRMSPTVEPLRTVTPEASGATLSIGRVQVDVIVVPRDRSSKREDTVGRTGRSNAGKARSRQDTPIAPAAPFGLRQM